MDREEAWAAFSDDIPFGSSYEKDRMRTAFVMGWTIGSGDVRLAQEQAWNSGYELGRADWVLNQGQAANPYTQGDKQA